MGRLFLLLHEKNAHTAETQPPANPKFLSLNWSVEAPTKMKNENLQFGRWNFHPTVEVWSLRRFFIRV